MEYIVRVEIPNWPLKRSVWTARPLVELMNAGVFPTYLAHGNHTPNKGRGVKVINMRFSGEAPDEFVWLKLKHNAVIVKKKPTPEGETDWTYPGPHFHDPVTLPPFVARRYSK